VTAAGDPTNVLAQFQRLDIYTADIFTAAIVGASTPVVFAEEAALAIHRVGPAQVAEPATTALLRLGLSLVAFRRRRAAA
jgi:hypothetical protein